MVPLANMTHLISFGGREDPRERYGDRRPVVLFHGQGSYAGQLYLIREELLKAGYKPFEIFGTTIGEAAGDLRTILTGTVIRSTGSFYGKPDQELPRGPMICLYMRQLRKFFEYVWEYTRSLWNGDKTNYKIDVVGDSMGVLTSRKVILGGKCVDDPSIDLGPPLTDKVHTYIGIAGPNNGSHLCTGKGKRDTRAKIANLLPGCNLVTGFRPDSAFMKDINLIETVRRTSTPPVKHGYEGQLRFSFVSFDHDETVGYNTLGGMGFGNCHTIQDNEKAFNNHEYIPHKNARVIAQMLANADLVNDTCSNSSKLKNDTSQLPDNLKKAPLSTTLGFPEYTDVKDVISALYRAHSRFPDNNVVNNVSAALNKNGLGDVCVSLKYCRTAQALTVIIVEAKILKETDFRGLADPYIKLYLYEGKTVLSEKKTSVKRKTLDPHYFESFEFRITPAKMERVHLMFSVLHYGPKDEIVGNVVLASEKLKIGSIPLTGQEQWSEMMRTGRTLPVHCYSLVGRK
ncbi:lipase (class 2) domain-containing protein [Ditylenchus destructor]|uniref:Lipase (Class 2) domain-containing protein n=1 Tax=Ditylenchus destructor TaxID=166010 RepID=A0AAD4MMS0_9BILA|nr:lipase (class 2) domain-containing protein [Ditylenchus destructor]